MALGAYAGLRAGEVRALTWGDVDLVQGTLTVRQATCRGVTASPKSGDQRLVPLAAPLRKLLMEAKERSTSDLVATTAEGKPWGEHGLIQVVKRASKRAGIGTWRFHDLRHYFCTQLFRSGASAPTVQALGGWASLTVAQRYAHTTQADLRAAVETAW